MTRTAIIAFAKAQAFHDFRFGRTASAAEFTQALEGFAACQATLKLDGGEIRRKDLRAGIETYRQDRGALLLMRETVAHRVAMHVCRPVVLERHAGELRPLRLRLRKAVPEPQAIRGWCGPLTSTSAAPAERKRAA